ncbi:putative endodeoxyribonuclease Ecym_2692 [Eremothecium cymbalariae DBVPG|uniref:TatD related DNase n=1 Tax=Eremothecium cymbalariae (strain CBS 270.75 / DBVPG 7215 / KCTC 17166 / NRRL Y-17582) TaxID=931890 RepID=G8JPD4_ERECY|nr:Hypothetical protein Ecym_2692 [Eremothecium cymbalariae DBVPG\
MVQYIDSHCHLTTSSQDGGVGRQYEVDHTEMQLYVMSCNALDWKALKAVGVKQQDIVVGFGVQPYYSHLFRLGGGASVSKEEHYKGVLESKDGQQLCEVIGVLPEPINIEEYITGAFEEFGEQIRCIGEIGLDGAFRLPSNGFNQEDSTGDAVGLTNVRVRMSHQVAIFKRFCEVAVAKRLPVSIHSVRCHGKMFELCRELLLPHEEVKIDMHSYSGSVESVSTCWLRCFPQNRIYFGISKIHSLKNYARGLDLLRSIPLECLLTETDLPVNSTPAQILKKNIEYVIEAIRASHKLASTHEAVAQIYENSCRFLSV